MDFTNLKTSTTFQKYNIYFMFSITNIIFFVFLPKKMINQKNTTDNSVKNSKNKSLKIQLNKNN